MSTTANARFVVDRADNGRWRWVLQTRNFKILAKGAHEYVSKEKCLEAVEKLVEAAPLSPVWNPEEAIWEMHKSQHRLWRTRD